MSNVLIYTHDGSASGVTSTQGSKVFVGDTELLGVTGVELVAEIFGVWTLRITVPVDPAKLFAPLPKVA